MSADATAASPAESAAESLLRGLVGGPGGAQDFPVLPQDLLAAQETSRWIAAFDALFERVEGVLARVEALLPPPTKDPDWRKVTAARWRKHGGRGYLQGVPHPHVIALSDLVAIDEQKKSIDQNTRQFVAGLPANNVLLTGSRGTGKASLVKAMLAKYAGK